MFYGRFPRKTRRKRARVAHEAVGQLDGNKPTLGLPGWMRRAVAALIQRVAPVVLLALALAGCGALGTIGPRDYHSYPPATCYALGGDVSLTTRYRSPEGGWWLARASCSTPKRAEVKR